MLLTLFERRRVLLGHREIKLLTTRHRMSGVVSLDLNPHFQSAVHTGCHLLRCTYPCSRLPIIWQTTDSIYMALPLLILKSINPLSWKYSNKTGEPFVQHAVSGLETPHQVTPSKSQVVKLGLNMFLLHFLLSSWEIKGDKISG